MRLSAASSARSDRFSCGRAACLARSPAHAAVPGSPTPSSGADARVAKRARTSSARPGRRTTKAKSPSLEHNKKARTYRAASPRAADEFANPTGRARASRRTTRPPARRPGVAAAGLPLARHKRCPESWCRFLASCAPPGCAAGLGNEHGSFRAPRGRDRPQAARPTPDGSERRPARPSGSRPRAVVCECGYLPRSIARACSS